MFKKVSKKSFMLFIGVLAVSAFAMPAMASAASWAPGNIGTTHILDASSANPVSFNVAAVGAGSTCGISQFHVDIRSAFDATVTSAAFKSCMGTGAAVTCTVTETATRLPWTITNPTTTNITIDGIHIDILYENTPGAPGNCALPGTITLTGNLHNGAWSQPSHEITWANAGSLVQHIDALAGSFPTVISGTIFDTAGTLTLTD